MDRILEAFLGRQLDDAVALNAASDLVSVLPVDERVFVRESGAANAGMPTRPNRYLARFTCAGLVRAATGAIIEANEFHVGVRFPSSYLRWADPFQVVTWLGPPNTFHPNISARFPHICIGRLAPGTPLADILAQCFEIITYQKVTMREDDALNPDACVWARRNQHRFPIDTRPMSRRAVEFAVERIS